jgi:hypothetical protein
VAFVFLQDFTLIFTIAEAQSGDVFRHGLLKNQMRFILSSAFVVIMLLRKGAVQKVKKSMKHKTKLIEKRSQEGIMPLKRSGEIQ